MRASLIEKGIAQPVLPFAHIDQPEKPIPLPPPPPPLPASLRPPMPPPRSSSTKDNIYSNDITPQNRDVECQTTPRLQRTTKNEPEHRHGKHEPVDFGEHKIRQEEITVYYDQPPFFESFKIYQGYNPTHNNSIPVTFEPSVMCIHDDDSKTYESIQPSNNSTSSTEELFYSGKLTCKEIQKHCCYYIFCCGLCCD